MIYHENSNGIIYNGDCLDILKELPDNSVDTCITSPPYWGLRDYGTEGQLGLEKTPEEYVANMVKLFREVRRVMKQDGVLWLNLGDSYNGSQRGSGGTGALSSKQNSNKGANFAVGGKAIKTNVSGLKPKDLVGIPWRVAFALQADGWWLRQDIIWHKPNPMPESVKDRCTKSHEYIFMLTKSARYYFDSDAIKENRESVCTRKRSTAFRQQDENPDSTITTIGRNKRSVWTVTTKPFKDAHFATFPKDLILPCVLVSKPDAIILDPFFGSGTTGIVAMENGRNYIGIDLNAEYCEIAKNRIVNCD